ncbi:MAG: cytochrome c oxidase assembly protein [Rhizobiaceae bacterium]|jgi:cytochrome c oxidase assembly protein subunit 11
MAGNLNSDQRARRRNMIAAGVCTAVFVGMVGLSYAAVPLYRMFCQVTGYGGTTQRSAEGARRVLDQTVKVRFDANTSNIPWSFKPAQWEIEGKIGETMEAHYVAQNLSDHVVRGRASFNVTPEFAGAYFYKIQCFCFNDTTLKPGEKIDMPVIFYVDPDIVNAEEAKGLKTITLSYTMFQVPVDKVAAAGAKSTNVATNTTGDTSIKRRD